MHTVPDAMQSLPESVEALRALVLVTVAGRDAAVIERDTLLVQNDRLRHVLLKLTRMQFGARSERLPEQQLHTTAFWLDLPPEVARRFPRPALQGGLHGMANVISQVACLFLMCDARDLGAYAETRAPHSGMPSVFVYERYPGGVGMSARLFEMTGAVLAAAHDLVSRCACESGCPSCVGPALEVGEEGKAVVLQLLELAALAPAS